jgi:hypothetical protein
MLVQGHQLLLCSLASSQLKNLMEQETWSQEIPHRLMYGHFWRPFWTCHWDMPVSLIKFFFFFIYIKSRTSGLGTTVLKCQIIRIFDYQSDERNFALTFNLQGMPRFKLWEICSLIIYQFLSHSDSVLSSSVFIKYYTYYELQFPMVLPAQYQNFCSILSH